MTERTTITRTVRVAHLARVEGHGMFQCTVRNGKVERSELRLFEAPRFFEALLRGRDYAEAPDITARICGICPVAYQMSACQAMEDALGITLDEELVALRRLLYCGEWLESHALHVYLLHAPDFFGMDDVIALARDHGDVVRRGLQLKKAGNEIVRIVGGREIHPVNVRVGGFHRIPDPRALDTLHRVMEEALDIAIDTVRLVAGFTFPDLTWDHELVALRDPDRYAMYTGRLTSTGGLDIPVQEFEQHVREVHVPHSNALQARLAGRAGYVTGPLARVVLNGDQLHPVARAEAEGAGLDAATARNPFRSIVARAVEMVHACEEALGIIGQAPMPSRPYVPATVRAGEGFGASEAPRGVLYHRYQLDASGAITSANIVPPTSQNQGAVEEDLGRLVEGAPDLSQEDLTWQCEQLVRCYDPCISCATHAMDVRVERI